MTTVRIAARPADEEGILSVVAVAFSDSTRDASEELEIVRATWAVEDAGRLIELVADDNGTVVGHVLAAPGRIDGAPTACGRRGSGVRGAVASATWHRDRPHGRPGPRGDVA